MSLHFDTGLPASRELQLQVCGECGQVNYPRRELCGRCLADALQWQAVNPSGQVQSITELHYSLEAEYAAHLPWPVASVKMDCGPVVFAHLDPGCAIGDPVQLRTVADNNDNLMLAALHGDGDPGAASDWLASIEFKEIQS